jgi:hypothetical protein
MSDYARNAQAIISVNSGVNLPKRTKAAVKAIKRARRLNPLTLGADRKKALRALKKLEKGLAL